MRIPLFKSFYDQGDIDNIVIAMKSGSHWANSKNIELFEENFAKYLGRKYAVAFNSGTSALHASALALDIDNDGQNQVIVPSFTFIATCNTPRFVKARPVFADIEDETFGLETKDVLSKINRYTRAIIPIHFAGFPAKNIFQLRTLCDSYKIFMIEDACESLGAEIDGRKVGTFGDISCFSFCQNKLITTGEGGMAVTDNEQWYEELKLIRSHGQKENDFVSLGYNWRMPSILAVLGNSQLEKIDYLIDRRIAIAEQFPMREKGLGKGVYQMIIIRSHERDKIKQELSDAGIESKVYFNPVHLTSFYRSYGHKEGELPITERVAKELLSIPIYIDMTDEEINHIKTII